MTIQFKTILCGTVIICLGAFPLAAVSLLAAQTLIIVGGGSLAAVLHG